MSGQKALARHREFLPGLRKSNGSSNTPIQSTVWTTTGWSSFRTGQSSSYALRMYVNLARLFTHGQTRSTGQMTFVTETKPFWKTRRNEYPHDGSRVP